MQIYPTDSNQKLNPPTGPAEWSRLLFEKGMDYRAFLVAFAAVGIMAMLKRRVWMERETPENDKHTAGRNNSQMATSWISPIQWWADAGREHEHEDLPCSVILKQLPILKLAAGHESELALARELMAGIEAYPEGRFIPFTKRLSEHWGHLLKGSQSRSHQNIGEPSGPLRSLISGIVPLEAHQRLLVITGNQNLLFWEMLEKIEFYSTAEKPGSDRALMGVTVITDNLETNLFAWMSLLSHDIAEPEVKSELVGTSDVQDYYDWVIATPEWGMRMPVSQPDLPVPTRKAENAILQNALRCLKPTGHAIALLPRAFAVSKEAASLRQWLLEEWRVDAIIELPASAASVGSAVVSLLLSIRRAPKFHDVFYIGEELTKRRFTACKTSPNHEPLELICRLLRIFSGCARPQDIAIDSLEKAETPDASWNEISRENNALFGLLNLRSNEQGHALAPRVLADLSTGFVDIASLAKDDYEFRPPSSSVTEDSLERTLEILCSRNPGVSVVTLGEITDISSGITYARKQTSTREELPSPQPKNLVGLLRIGDLSRKRTEFGVVYSPRTPELVLKDDCASQIPDHAILRKDDLVMSKTGTIGRVNLYRGPDELFFDNLQNVASSQLAIIRPHEGISPLFLANLLSSPPYQEWLVARTVGAVMHHLRIKDIAAIPVLLAPKHIQAAIAEHLLAGSPLELLADAITNGPRKDPTLLAFLDDETIRGFGDETTEGKSIEHLVHFSRAVRNRINTWRLGDGLLGMWWGDVADTASELLGILELADPRDRFTSLQVWLAQFRETSSSQFALVSNIRLSESPNSTQEADALILRSVRARAANFFRSFKQIAESESGRLLEDIRFEGTLSPATVPAGIATVVTARLTNHSALSVRSSEIRIGSSQGQAGLLAPGSSIEVPFTFLAAEIGSHPLLMEWSAKRLDGIMETGTSELSVEAVLQSDPVEDSFGTNPYVDARTLKADEDRVFFGREQEISRILAELHKPSASTILLMEGNRRTGKTSLVDHFTRRYLPENWIAAYCTFQSGEGVTEVSGEISGRGVPTREVFFILAKAVVEAVVSRRVALELDGIGVFDPAWRPILLFSRTSSMLRPYFESGPPYERFRIVLDQCLEAMAPRRLLLIIDEFDRLQEGINSGVTSTQVPENIRHLFQTYNQMAGILTGSRKIRRLREEYWNVLFGIGDPLIIRGLEINAARDLITKPVAGRITYAPTAVDLLVHLTAGQPRIIQTLCSRLFDRCVMDGTKLVTEEMVEAVAAEKARDYEHFKVLWSAIQDPAHQFVALTINRLEQSGLSSLRFQPIHDEITGSRLAMNEEDLEAALGNLIDLEVVGEKVTESTKYYFIEIPLLARWIMQNQDADKLLETAINENLTE